MSEQEQPNILGMMKSFTRDLAKYIKEGAPNVSPDDYAQRLDACNNCEHIKKVNMRCGLCGCLVEHKAKWKTTNCPDNPSRWKDQGYTPPPPLSREERNRLADERAAKEKAEREKK